ncbi:uncharacterized protein MKZ38_005051 [Zalerion maritima]|uniref:Uncharacterized protein n=1 Tax=Zalerion maritima TaxID=339359 RepID=A0AAD5RL67_9PEZI|nr:uncharacterized protein MKZ38_005051 [Zalerion maritima]
MSMPQLRRNQFHQSHIGCDVTADSQSVGNANVCTSIDKDHGQVFAFKPEAELTEFKFQRYMQRYLGTAPGIDGNVGRMFHFPHAEGHA